MRLLRPLAFASMLFAALPSPAWASQQFLVVIASTNAVSKNDTNTAAPFSLPLGLAYAVQCDQAAWVETHCSSGSCVAVANQSRFLQQSEPWEGSQDPQHEQHIATLCASAATCNCWVSARYASP